MIFKKNIYIYKFLFFLSNPNSQQQYILLDNRNKNDMNKYLNDLNFEKKVMMNKVKDLESKLQISESKSELLETDKETLIDSFKNIVYELKKSKTSKKNIQDGINENNIKTEIRDLANQLINTKKKLESVSRKFCYN